MFKSDSVSLFAEGTFEEQIQELVNYLTRGLSDEARTAFIKPFQDVLITRGSQKPLEEDSGRRRQTIIMVLAEVKNLGQGSDRETEGFFNLLYSHVLSLFPETSKAQEHLRPLLATISSAPSETPTTKYRILSNLFNALPRQSPLRLQVLNVLLPLVVSNGDLEVLQITRSTVDRWLSEWDIPQEEKTAFLKNIADAFNQAGNSETSYSYLLSRVELLPESSPDANTAALDTIVATLQLPTVFDLNHLLKVKALQTVKDHPLFGLLRILLYGDLAQYQQWQATNISTIGEFGLDATALDRKIRFLTLASLATQHVGKDLAYGKIVSALQIESNQVEVWVIDAIRAKLLSGKLSQPTQTFHVTRAMTRAFEQAEWKLLEEKLVSWRSGLVGVLEVVVNARKSTQVPVGPAVVQLGVPIVHGDLAKEVPTAVVS